MAGSSFGPRLHAAIAYLTANHRVSRRGIAEIMANLFGINISTGAVCKVNERVSEDCRPVVGAIKRYVAAAALLNIDETGWKNKGNNRAERAIRPAVQWRKLCFGSQSDSGERFVERLLSVTATCRLHGVNPFEFLTKVVSSASAGEQPPQLLPQQYHLNLGLPIHSRGHLGPVNGYDLFSGSYFAFCNRRRDVVKILYRAENGFCLWMKRLETDVFRWPDSQEQVVEISPTSLDWLLHGLDVRQAHQRLDFSTVS